MRYRLTLFFLAAGFAPLSAEAANEVTEIRVMRRSHWLEQDAMVYSRGGKWFCDSELMDAVPLRSVTTLTKAAKELEELAEGESCDDQAVVQLRKGHPRSYCSAEPKVSAFLERLARACGRI